MSGLLKRRFRAFIGAALAIFVAVPALATPTSGSLQIAVSNVRNSNGQVHVDLCIEREFLKDCAYSANAPARVGVTIVTLPQVPAGRYAVQATHDENGNAKVDTALFGIPKEGVGFSNDAPIRMSPPKFADAAFVYTPPSKSITLKLRYFLGAKGPR